VEAQTKEELARLSAAGGGAGNSYVNMLYLLLRLRQACNHPWLVKGAGQTFRRKAGTASAAQLAAVRRLAPDTRNALLAALRGHQSQCPVCGDIPEDAVVTRCGHVYCQQCVAAQQCMAAQQEADNGSEGEFTCQACNSTVPKEDVFSGVALEAEAGDTPPPDGGTGATTAAAAGASGGARNMAEEQWASSSKVDKLLALLEEVRNRNKGAAGASSSAPGRPSGINMLIGRSRGDAAIAKQLRQVSPDGTAGVGSSSGRPRPEKVIVFSQWTSMLDLLEIPLKKGRYQYR
jgi:SNF2 family DNA or RNA helicase